jgi:TonB family protein
LAIFSKVAATYGSLFCMNGQFETLSALSLDAGRGGPQSGCTCSRRLLAALICSCVLHAIVAILLYLLLEDQNGRVGKGGRARPSALFATLLAVDKTERLSIDQSSAGLPEQESSVPTEVRGAEPASSNDADDPETRSIPGGAYYPTDQLTVRPKALAAVELDMPETAIHEPSGKMILSLRINEDGEVVDASVETNDLSERVSNATVEAFRKLRFKPGEINGKAVAVVMKIEAFYGKNRFPER